MDVQVKHDGTDISNYVIAYEREHKICTGIGNLLLTVAYSIDRTFNPWDSIDIYENGDFKVRYYVSSVSINEPSATITVDCQDASKRLVDYYISDSYNIDYPTYTRYWIDKFIEEAGLQCIFTTNSQGSILSNNTQLGMASAYEQVLTLLQMSGWHMYFDGNGKAVIGVLDVDLASLAGSVDKEDIVDIMKVSHDKMLRNRAVVLGAFDPETMSQARAEVIKHTPWNYDNRDIRSVLISNQNIPNASIAYGMANQLIKEFAKITVEKHITLHGAKDYNIGTVLRVSANVWNGRGLITTFGTAMDRNGLVTRVILDERCPRLYGFFDYGDYVYVGFYGDGVWRKHIKFDHTWYNFSTGLTNLNVTDLHINEGVFTSVGAGGEMFYTNSDSGPWHQVVAVTGLESSLADQVDPAIPYDDLEKQMYSGFMARATIVDKATNNVKYAIDTYSGFNAGDYFMYWYGSGIASSGSGVAGITISGMRGWIIEIDPRGGTLVPGMSGIGTYPVVLSGNYNYMIVDLENDGRNDYVSVATSGGQVIPFENGGYNFGYHITQQAHLTDDFNSRVSYNLEDDFNEEGETISGTSATGQTGFLKFSVFNNESIGERDVVWVQSVSGTRTLKRTRVSKSGGSLTASTLTSPSISYSNISTVCIAKASTDVYRLYYYVQNTPGSGERLNVSIVYIEWNTSSNTLSSLNTLSPAIIVYDDANVTSSFEYSTFEVGVVGDTITVFTYHQARSDQGSFFGTTNTENYLNLRCLKVVVPSNEVTLYNNARIDFNTREVDGTYDSDRWHTNYMAASNIGLATLLQNDTTHAWSQIYLETKVTGLSSTFRGATIWLVYSHDMVTFTKLEIAQITEEQGKEGTFIDTDSRYTNDKIQLTSNRYLYYLYNDPMDMIYIYNGLSVTGESGVTALPFQYQKANIWAMFGTHDYSYIAKDPATSKWYWCDSTQLYPSSEIEFPTGYTPIKPFSTSNSYTPAYFWEVEDDNTYELLILKYSLTGYLGTKITPYMGFSFTLTKGIICGNFFIDYDNTGVLKWMYVDNQDFPNSSNIYQVLRRDEFDYTLIQQEIYPIRLDISNYAPIVTAGSGESSFETYFVYDSEALLIEPAVSGFVGMPRQISDYRYTFLEPTLDSVVTSGAASLSTILYVTESGVYGTDASTYSGGFTLAYSVPSGHGTRIETSNYGLGGQYVFITASGFVQTFFQKDPSEVSFTDRGTGFPQSRATIIRLDDRM